RCEFIRPSAEGREAPLDFHLLAVAASWATDPKMKASASAPEVADPYWHKRTAGAIPKEQPAWNEIGGKTCISD
ncbi:MAG: hypothetical protein M1319_05585, partial [Chloroflexi bacterium]|nr:hypothetical protein [Chloroflexota bacterium]